jgi:hypothetical protein
MVLMRVIADNVPHGGTPQASARVGRASCCPPSVMITRSDAGAPLDGGAMTKKSQGLLDLEAAHKLDDTCPDWCTDSSATKCRSHRWVGRATGRSGP